jgi:hypothetical protein
VLVDLKLLSDHRDQLVRARTRLINRTHTGLVISHPGYEKKIPKLNSKKNQAAALTLLRGDRTVRADLIRDCISEIRRLSKKIVDVEKHLAGKLLGSQARPSPRSRASASWSPPRSSVRSAIPLGSSPREPLRS